MPFDDTQGKPEDKRLTKSVRALKEENILHFWKENQIFKKTLEKPAPQGEFVFFEGPPTANAKPALHHIAARIFKDVMPRYKTMQGFHVERQAGWDTHGLPVELQIEKKLGLKSKKEIESYGVEKFNKECRESVFEFIGEWEKFTDRIGYWTNLEEAYFTYHNSYIESVWSILSHVNDRNLLYKDYKVLPWCTRCGTALSSHELAQGYQDVKDLSLYVKFAIVGFPKAYFLAWTTTPWTLPGNVGLAVGADIVYVEAKVGEEIYVLAKEKLSLLTEPYEILAEHKGSEMVGMAYEPLYPFAQELASEGEKAKFDKAFKVYTADFVTTEDGTGIVHTAVMYGQEDFDLGNKVGLPKVHLVSPEGTFIKGTGWLEGRSVVEPELAVDILKDLQTRGLYFNKENHLHSYPFCWRCKTRLIYYARDSWYIRMSELRDELVAENQKINWEPEYIREGRFGEWLREVKDWAVSRERYWGTPLPVWEGPDGKRIVADSVDALKTYAKTSGNTFFFVRHGEADHNVLDICSSDPESPFHITEKGKEHVRATAEKLKGEHVDMIVRSPFLRAKETADLLADGIGFPKENITEDDRIREYKFGDFNLKPWKEYSAFRKGHEFDMDLVVPNGESLQQAKNRFGEFLHDLDGKYQNKKIVVVTHGIGFQVAPAIVGYTDQDHSAQLIKGSFRNIPDGSYASFSIVPLPHNENFELDLHKPFIDSIVLTKDGEDYTRVKEVMDVWFDSGSVPFAQGAEKRVKNGEAATDFSKILYPADFISEAIDQTRGWFYTMHAIGVLMERGHAYNNVICLGHILDNEGKKMSKSVGNILDPWMLMDKYGVDTLRLWMYAVNQPGESKNFDERSVDEIQKRVFNILDNVYSFYDLYRTSPPLVAESTPLLNKERGEGRGVLDEWILIRLDETIADVTNKLDNYKLLEPVRALRDFLDDLSTWYLRRSRDRIKEGDEDAKQTLYHVLKTVSKLLAPFAPFTAEELYQKLRTKTDPESVHLETWPDPSQPSPKLGEGRHAVRGGVLESMQETRRLVTLALEARSKANMKVRQPLAELKVKTNLDEKYLEIIKEELNVKKVTVVADLAGDIDLDITLTPELIEEGKVRDIIRSIQEMRKEKDLKPADTMLYEVPEADRDLFTKYADEIKKTTNVSF